MKYEPDDPAFVTSPVRGASGALAWTHLSLTDFKMLNEIILAGPISRLEETCADKSGEGVSSHQMVSLSPLQRRLLPFSTAAIRRDVRAAYEERSSTRLHRTIDSS